MVVSRFRSNVTSKAEATATIRTRLNEKPSASGITVQENGAGLAAEGAENIYPEGERGKMESGNLAENPNCFKTSQRSFKFLACSARGVSLGAR